MSLEVCDLCGEVWEPTYHIERVGEDYAVCFACALATAAAMRAMRRSKVKR